MKLFLSCLMLGIVITTTAQTTEVKDSVTDPHFTKVEKEAEYPGGREAWIKFIKKNLNPNTPVDHNAPVGEYPVIAKFVVSKDGTISDIECETNFGHGMEAEVIRILKLSGTWIPAEQDGKTLNAYRRQPVTFVVDQDNFTISTAKPHTLLLNTRNRIHVSAGRAKSENIEVSISAGTITDNGDGDYIVQVKEPGRVIITVKQKNKNKIVGQESFEVK